VTENQVQEQLAIIRAMVERSRRETAESGAFFKWIGIIGIIAVLVISGLEAGGLSHVVVAVVLAVFLASGVVGYLTVARRQRSAGARSYPATICGSVWIACSVPAIIVLFLFPLLGAYGWNLGVVIAALFMGVGAFVSGVVLEVRAVIWSSLAWWSGAVAMALVQGPLRTVVMVVVLLLGMVFPGMVLNRLYRERRGGDVS